MSYFPENTLTHYITKLDTPIILDSLHDWEVGLAEFQYPHTWFNINEYNNVFSVYIPTSDEPDPKTGKIPMEWKRCIIKKNNYKKPEKLIAEMNKQLHFAMNVASQDPVTLAYVKDIRKVKFKIPEYRVLALKKPLTYMLGLLKDSIGLTENTVSPEEIDLNGNYRDMYIYSDVIQYRLVGDVSTPLLRAIATEGKDKSTIRKIFQDIHYVPVSRSSFETIEIDIRTDTGQPVPFEKGRVDAVLHFRRRK
jgi:hypothetical protein